MSDFALVFDFITDCISEYILMLNSSWLTQSFLYLIVLGIVVSTILIMRGK